MLYMQDHTLCMTDATCVRPSLPCRAVQCTKLARQFRIMSVLICRRPYRGICLSMSMSYQAIPIKQRRYR